MRALMLFLIMCVLIDITRGIDRVATDLETVITLAAPKSAPVTDMRAP
jgi:hypothetical protein